MRYTIWNKDIDISDEYEDKWNSLKKGPLNSDRVEALAYTSGCFENSSVKDILTGVKNGIDDYYKAYNNLSEVKEQIKDKEKI